LVDVQNNIRWSYSDLNKYANQLAHGLLSQGSFNSSF